MPVSVRKRGKGFVIVEKKGGHTVTVGHSSSRKKAEASARARNAASHGWKPK